MASGKMTVFFTVLHTFLAASMLSLMDSSASKDFRSVCGKKKMLQNTLYNLNGRIPYAMNKNPIPIPKSQSDSVLILKR